MQSFLNWFVFLSKADQNCCQKIKSKNKEGFFNNSFIQIRHARTMPYVQDDGTSFLKAGLKIIKHCKNKF